MPAIITLEVGYSLLIGNAHPTFDLDKFPQFWNILLGEMSLVGTRPPTEDEAIHYSDRHWQRLNVKPGLTGEWQVNGRSTVKDFEAVLALDLHLPKTVEFLV